MSIHLHMKVNVWALIILELWFSLCQQNETRVRHSATKTWSLTMGLKSLWSCIQCDFTKYFLSLIEILENSQLNTLVIWFRIDRKPCKKKLYETIFFLIWITLYTSTILWTPYNNSISHWSQWPKFVSNLLWKTIRKDRPKDFVTVVFS